MKLLYFLPHITNNGGMERIVIDKINYLSDKGHDISLAYFGKEKDMPFFFLDEKVHRIAICEYKGTISFLSRIKQSFRIIYLLKNIKKMSII